MGYIDRFRIGRRIPNPADYVLKPCKMCFIDRVYKPGALCFTKIVC